MTGPSRTNPAGRAYLDLRSKARGDHRPVDELLQLYVLESFLARMADSRFADQFVLKGGVLLAAFGERRPTRDIDLQAETLDNDADNVRTIICEVAAAAFRAAQAKSGVEPPDTELLTWGSIMGMDEMRAFDVVERALSDAIATGELLPGAPHWRAKAQSITEAVLSRPLDLPPGQTLAGLVTTERIGSWIDAARHPLHREWRSAVANRLLHPIEPPSNPSDAVMPIRWLLERAAAPGGTELTQNNYLARATVLAAVEHFGWWDWDKPPRSEADVHQLSTLREATTRLRLLRRRGRRLHLTTHGVELLASPNRLWELVASEAEDGEGFTRAVTELVGLRLLQGRVEQRKLVREIAPILIAQGWSSGGIPITINDASSAVYRPLRWWRLFTTLDELEATWEYGTARELTPHSVALTPDGGRMVLAYLRSRAAGPRTSVHVV